MTVRAALAFIALSAPAYAQSGGRDNPAYYYATSRSMLAVYADTLDGRVDVVIVTGDSGSRAHFAAPKVVAWLDNGMMDALRTGPANDTASLALGHNGGCSVRLSNATRGSQVR
jgi:hypothetical protein